MGCSPPHLTLRRRQGSHEKALFLVALAELVAEWVLLLVLPLPLEVVLDADDILAAWIGQSLWSRADAGATSSKVSAEPQRRSHPSLGKYRTGWLALGCRPCVPFGCLPSSPNRNDNGHAG